MAVHDPESSTHEKALALKIGRQKKVQFIDGQQVELMTDDEESTAPGVVMSDANGQPYVVLEVCLLLYQYIIHFQNSIQQHNHFFKPIFR